MTEHRTRLGLWLMILTTEIFSSQDGITKHLTGNYPVAMVVMLRFWLFGVAACLIASRKAGGFRASIATHHPWLQGFRGVLVVVQISLTGYAFAVLGLIETHAVMACGPLIIAALSGPVLGEHVGWRRWTAIAVGALGVLIILRPDIAVFTVLSLLLLAAARLSSIYVLATRYVSRQDRASTAFLWTRLAGAFAITGSGLRIWTPKTPADWGRMLVLCCTSVIGHYLQLVFISFFGGISSARCCGRMSSSERPSSWRPGFSPFGASKRGRARRRRQCSRAKFLPRFFGARPWLHAIALPFSPGPAILESFQTGCRDAVRSHQPQTFCRPDRGRDSGAGHCIRRG